MNDKSVTRRIHADGYIVNQSAHEIKAAPPRTGSNRQCLGDHRWCGCLSIVADGDDHIRSLLVQTDIYRSSVTFVRMSVNVGKRFTHRQLDVRSDLQTRSDTHDCFTDPLSRHPKGVGAVVSVDIQNAGQGSHLLDPRRTIRRGIRRRFKLFLPRCWRYNHAGLWESPPPLLLLFAVDERILNSIPPPLEDDPSPR
jgi:hypothetical protein